MRHFFKACLFFFFFPVFVQAQFKGADLIVDELRCNMLVNPIGIGDPHPRLSWKFRGAQSALAQIAYELKVDETEFEGGVVKRVWNTGKVLSTTSTGISYTGRPLRSGHLYRFQVRIWDNNGHVSGWSKTAQFTMGLLASTDWQASWIRSSFGEDTVRRVPPVFRKAATIPQPIAAAKLYITAHGVYEASINGSLVAGDHFAPGWTSYDKRLQYQVYDVKGLLKKGMNEILVTVGDGWWRGVFGGDLTRNHYGTDAGLLCQLEIVYVNGKRDVIVSDGSWGCSRGPIRYADFYNGEVYDSRAPIYDRTNEGPVCVLDLDTTKDHLVASETPGVRKHERFKPIKVYKDSSGARIYDFGQNISGWVGIRAHGAAGDSIKVQHAEALDKDGRFYTGNLREAKAEDIYVLTGKAYDVLEPHFTYHGFRYARVRESGKNPGIDDIEAIALYTDLPATGSFECSSPLLNQLQHNILWSQRDNFIDIPTDCPQRSERYGWTGDAQIFAQTACFNQGTLNFFSKWLKDLAADQDSLGGLPVIIPDLYGHKSHHLKRAVAGWGDAATIIPWTLYEIYGDTTILRAQYPSMRAWVDNIRRLSPDDFWNGTGYGDWLAPDTVVLTPLPFISQCYFAHSTDLLIKAASVLGLREDSVRYSDLLEKIKAALLKVYTPLPATQTGCVMALAFDLLPDSLRPAVARQLVELVHSHGDHLSTGFLGTPYLLPVLSEMGETELAYKVLLQQTLPGWLYPITKGATTIWEKWDAIAPDGTVGEKSLNHYSYGAVGDWLYREVAGISEAAPGYKKILIAPHPGGGLTWVKGSYECPYGRIVSNWRIEAEEFFLHVEIPPNTTARVMLPGADQPILIGSGSYDYAVTAGFGGGVGAG